MTDTWVHEDDDTSSGSTLAFSADGTFVYEDLPAEIVDPTEWVSGSGCNDVVAGSTDLRSGAGTWELMESGVRLDFSGAFTWAHPSGFLSFDRLEFICDIDHAGSYVLDRAD